MPLPPPLSTCIPRFLFINLNTMAFPVSEVVLPMRNDTTRDPDEIYNDLQAPKILVKKESPQKEKQISVDPISLRESSMKEPSFNFMVLPVITAPRDSVMHLPQPLHPAKPNFLSCSLPNSATSSPRFTATSAPRFSSILSWKKWKNESQASPRQLDNVARQQAAAHSQLALLQESLFRRSKSCGEGRACAPSDEFDLWLHKPNAIEYKNRHNGSFSRTEANRDSRKSGKNMDPYDEGFKCGALCLFLPGFSKAKPVRARKEEAVVMENVVSRTVSLEKFECGSWASSAFMHEHDEDGDSMNLYFDLPFELIRSSVNDAHSPVSAAFVFDKDRKGVLKNGLERVAVRKSHESSRHVRFSTSSADACPASPASCITPRLRKAREDFNAFLDSQSA